MFKRKLITRDLEHIVNSGFLSNMQKVDLLKFCYQIDQETIHLLTGFLKRIFDANNY